jgi:hypothetical protein
MLAVAGSSNNTFDSRSDDKGPEPEGVAVGRVGARAYAFIALERIGGVMIYDVTEPRSAYFVDCVNGKEIRDFDQPVCWTVSSTGSWTSGVPNRAAGDLGPEGFALVSAKDSPNGVPLLIVGDEISGSARIFDCRSKQAHRPDRAEPAQQESDVQHQLRGGIEHDCTVRLGRIDVFSQDRRRIRNEGDGEQQQSIGIEEGLRRLRKRGQDPVLPRSGDEYGLQTDEVGHEGRPLLPQRSPQLVRRTYVAQVWHAQDRRPHRAA